MYVIQEGESLLMAPAVRHQRLSIRDWRNKMDISILEFKKKNFIFYLWDENRTINWRNKDKHISIWILDILCDVYTMYLFIIRDGHVLTRVSNYTLENTCSI